MAYAIMRCKKLKAGGAASSLSHTYRERETLNADPVRTADNEHLLATSTDQAMGAMRDLLPDKYRKDAVVAVEYLFTTSPEWAASASPDQQQAFFDKSREWLEEKHGRQNVFVATVHRDETTPHLVAYVVPMTTDGRLCAKDFLGGRDKLRAMQSTFAEKVADLGLDRGIEGSPANHKRIKQHYAEINQKPKRAVEIDLDALKPQKVGDGLLGKLGMYVEDDQAVAKRVTSLVAEQTAPFVAKAAERDSAKQETKVLADRVKVLQKRAMELKDLTHGLTDAQKLELKKTAEKHRERNAQERKVEVQRKRERSRSQSRDRGGHEH